jgi:hypothetical protein
MRGIGADREIAGAGGATIPPFGRFNQMQVVFAEIVALAHPRAGEMNTAMIARHALPLLAEARRLARRGESDVLVATMQWAKNDERVFAHLQILNQSEMSFVFGMVELAALQWQGESVAIVPHDRPSDQEGNALVRSALM